jgi:hypothetical protein
MNPVFDREEGGGGGATIGQLPPMVAMAYDAEFIYVLRAALGSGKMVVVPAKEGGPLPRFIGAKEPVEWVYGEGRRGATRVSFDAFSDRVPALMFGAANTPLMN